MIYCYLRVSSDEQDVNSQKQGVESFAKEKGWMIDEYITDEGVSGGKDPDKRNLGPLLQKLHKGDIIIASEISRLGRDLYMVMDILHFCMKTECTIYTVKDKFILGDDIQSKVLAFAFGLSAEIERQMIRQRTKEGLKLRMKLGVLLGRPIGRRTCEGKSKIYPFKEQIIEQWKWGVPFRRLAENFKVDRNTIYRALIDWECYKDEPGNGELRKFRKKENASRRREKMMTYKDETYKVVNVDREKMQNIILQDLTIPQIADRFPEYSYEQIYDTILCDHEFNNLYRKHGQLKLTKKTNATPKR